MLLVGNNGLIRLPIVAKNDGLFIIRWDAIPEYSACFFTAITAGISNDFSGFSIQRNPDPNFENCAENKSEVDPNRWTVRKQK